MVAQCRRGRAECGVAAAVLGQTPGHRPVTSYSTRVIAMPVLQAVPHLSSIETESTVHLLI